MKILITGGHVTPALAVIEELKKHKNLKIVFVGRKYALDFEKTPSFEYQSIKNLGLKFIELKAGRLTRVLCCRTIINFFRFPFGFLRAFQILKHEKPDVILSFGGYLALPITISAWFVNIPIFTHEQTIVPGLTNRIISFLAKKVFISFPETARYFNPPSRKSPIVRLRDVERISASAGFQLLEEVQKKNPRPSGGGSFKKNKVVFTGNPLRTSIFLQPSRVLTLANSSMLGIQHDKKTIYITGGSLGAHSLNVVIEQILSRLLAKFIVIHQTGNTEEYGDFGRLSKIKNESYFVRRHFYDDEIGCIYSLADFIISRSGANTVFELMALQKPAILIPLPWSAHREQKAQAEFLKDKGVAEIFYQDNGTDDPSDRLYKLVIRMANNLAKYQRNFTHLEDYYKKDAAKKIVEHVLAKD